MLELRGAEPEATNRKYGVTAATLTGRPEAFLEGGESGLKIRATDVVDEKQKTLKSAVANLVTDNELLRQRIRQMEQEKAFSTVEVEAMGRTHRGTPFEKKPDPKASGGHADAVVWVTRLQSRVVHAGGALF